MSNKIDLLNKLKGRVIAEVEVRYPDSANEYVELTTHDGLKFRVFSNSDHTVGIVQTPSAPKLPPSNT